MLVLLALLAHAADEAPSVRHALYLVERAAPREAAAEAAALLSANADDLGAHRAYVAAWASERPGHELVTMYRGWLEREPASVGARYGLAQALSRVEAEDSGTCDELPMLLEPLPDDPVTRYWAARVRESVIDACDLDAGALTDELIALGAEAPEAWGHALGLRLDRGLDAALLADLRRAYVEQPERLGQAARLWAPDRRGPLVGKARKDALAAAEAAEADSEDPIALHYAAYVLRAAGKGERATALLAEVARLEPVPRPSNLFEMTPLHDEIYEASRKPTHEVALAALDALASRIPASGPERATWEWLRGERLGLLGRKDEAYAAIRNAALADAGAAWRGNAFAWQAAVRGEDLDQALGAIDRSLAWLYADTWDGTGPEGWEGWARRHRDTIAAWEDTRGWVLYRMGRLPEARAALERAVVASAGPELHAHLGLVLLALDEERAAFEHLARASEPGSGLSEEVAGPVRDGLARLWPTAGIWHPGGLEGWLADRAGPDDDDEHHGGDDHGGPAAHPLMGQPFPIDEVTRLAGGQARLADIEGVRVVDMWATWCGPCVAGMPHLQQVAAAYEDKGVTVVGLSVDEELAPAKRFFQGAGDVGYELAWIGESGLKRAKVHGIPALFVLDANGVVAAFVEGYQGQGDTRLEAALDALLAR